MDWSALRLTLLLATATTLVLTVFGLPFAYWLAMTRWRGRFLLESLVALPLVLPPTVLGFYLLVAFGPEGAIGAPLAAFTGTRLPFTFAGLLIGSCLYNLPFAVRPFLAAFSGMNRRFLEVSWCLGESEWWTFWRVTVPLCWPGLLTGIVLTFAHALGEFGVVLMIGGNIPGVTRTLSLAIYDDVQALDYRSANQTAVLLVLGSFLTLVIVHWLGRRQRSGLP